MLIKPQHNETDYIHFVYRNLTGLGIVLHTVYAVMMGMLKPQEISMATRTSKRLLIKTLKKLRIPVSPPMMVIKMAKTMIKAPRLLILAYPLSAAFLKRGGCRGWQKRWSKRSRLLKPRSASPLRTW